MGNSQTVGSTEENISFRSLDLSRKLTPEEYLKHTRGVHLEGCLQTIPTDIVYYDTISLFEDMNFSFNIIDYVPEEFSLRVPHLRHLDISHNQLTGLPNSFHLLLHLRFLDISFNKFGTFPEVTARLRKLETLNIAHNTLPDLPSSICNLKELKRLNVSHNHLRALPESLLECPSLNVIVTVGNSLIHPPQTVCDLGSAATLAYLSQKRIETQEKPHISPNPCKGVFTRVRGQQVMASVVNPESASREYQQAQGTGRSNKRKCPLMVPENATSLPPDKLTETILGLVYGACIGDAFGLNMEGLSREECAFFYDREPFSLNDRIRDLLRSYFPPGDWSSNVDVMLLTLDSLMRWGGVVDELELASQMVQWRVHGFTEIDPFPGHPLSPLLQQVVNSEGYVGHPHSVTKTLHRKLIDKQNRGLDLNVNLNDNSCLPAAVVLGIPNFYKENEVRMNAERICRATHASSLPVAGCIFTATVAAYLLQGRFQSSAADPSLLLTEAMTMATASLNEEDATKVALEKLLTDDETPQSVARNSPLTDDVTITLKFLTSALRTSVEAKKKKGHDVINFESVLSRFLTVGGDGLSAHCCVLGGILGAFFGYSNIPQRWLKQLPKENIAWLNAKLNHLLDLFGLP